MSITVQECFTPGQKAFLDKVYQSEWNEKWEQWLLEAEVYLKQYIDVELERKETIKSLSRLYIQYAAYSIPNYESISENKMAILIDNLKTIRENQKKKNVNVSRIKYSENREIFTDKFWSK